MPTVRNSTRQDVALYQAPIGALNDLDPFGDYGVLQLRLVRHVDLADPVKEVGPSVKRWSLVSLRNPKLPEKELMEDQARDLLETFFMRSADRPQPVRYATLGIGASPIHFGSPGYDEAPYELCALRTRF